MLPDLVHENTRLHSQVRELKLVKESSQFYGIPRVDNPKYLKANSLNSSLVNKKLNEDAQSISIITAWPEIAKLLEVKISLINSCCFEARTQIDWHLLDAQRENSKKARAQ